jgi:hypothetical protein
VTAVKNHKDGCDVSVDNPFHLYYPNLSACGFYRQKLPNQMGLLTGQLFAQISNPIFDAWFWGFINTSGVHPRLTDQLKVSIKTIHASQQMWRSKIAMRFA